MGSVTKTNTELEIGKEYRVIAQNHGHRFDIGENVKVVEFYADRGDYKAIHLDGRDYWYIRPDEVEEV